MQTATLGRPVVLPFFRDSFPYFGEEGMRYFKVDQYTAYPEEVQIGELFDNHYPCQVLGKSGPSERIFFRSAFIFRLDEFAWIRDIFSSDVVDDRPMLDRFVAKANEGDLSYSLFLSRMLLLNGYNGDLVLNNRFLENFISSIKEIE